jgi:Uma2 family endonuclease
MPTILISIPQEKEAKEFLRLVRHFRYVEKAEIQKNGAHKQHPAQNGTMNDLEKILARYPADKQWTYTEMCQVFPPESRIELMNNQITIMPSPTFKHQTIVKKLSRLIDDFIGENNGTTIISPFDVKFSEDDTTQPDIIYVAPENEEIIKEKCIEGAPNLLVEVLSNNKKDDLVKKKKLYEEKGVKEYWTVAPKKQEIKVNTLEGKKYEIFSEAKKQGSVKSKLLKGFEVFLEKLF